MKFEVATLDFISQKLKVHKFFLIIWQTKIFRNIVNAPRKLSHSLTGKPSLQKREDASEILRISSELKLRGIAFASLNSFQGMPTLHELCEEYEDLLVREKSKPHSRKSKIYIERLIDDDYDFKGNRGNALHLYVSHPSLKLVAANYLDMIPKLTSFKVWRSHFTGDKFRTASQNWHRDYNEFKMLRIFLYFNKVEIANGAGEYVSGSHYLGDSYNKLEYSEEMGTYATDDEIAENFSSERILKAEGSAGTIVFMDTAGLHRGGYHTAPESERRVALVTFSTAADIMPSKINARHLKL